MPNYDVRVLGDRLAGIKTPGEARAVHDAYKRSLGEDPPEGTPVPSKPRPMPPSLKAAAEAQRTVPMGA